MMANYERDFVSAMDSGKDAFRLSFIPCYCSTPGRRRDTNTQNWQIVPVEGAFECELTIPESALAELGSRRV